MDGFVDITFIVSEQCGVYILMLNDECIYVGQSTKVYKRIQQHRANGLIEFNRVLVQFCDKHELDKVEYNLINQLKPSKNKQNKVEITLKQPIDLAKLGLHIAAQRD